MREYPRRPSSSEFHRYRRHRSRRERGCEQANSLAQPIKTRREREEEKAAKKRIKQLERELRRKDAALAETAALLVLRKKAEALWGKDEDE